MLLQQVLLPLAASAAATNYADTAISAVLANPADAMLVLISLAIYGSINDLKTDLKADIHKLETRVSDDINELKTDVDQLKTRMTVLLLQMPWLLLLASWFYFH